jgi:hypothetical protein
MVKSGVDMVKSGVDMVKSGVDMVKSGVDMGALRPRSALLQVETTFRFF